MKIPKARASIAADAQETARKGSFKYASHRFLCVANLTISVDEQLMRQIKAHPGINWSEAAREGLRRRLQEIHIWDELLKDSQLTEEDVERLADQVDEAMARRLRELSE